MAYNPNSQNNNNSSDKPKADAWLNLKSVVGKDGTEYPLPSQGIYNSPLYKNTENALLKVLMERAQENDGELEITLKAKIVIVNNEPTVVVDASNF